MKKERFDFVAMLISLFLLSVFVVEKQLMGTIGGTLVSPVKAQQAHPGKTQGTLQSSMINSSLLISTGSSFTKNTVFNLKSTDVVNTDRNIRTEQH
jgi:hypothetical protein